MADQSLAQSRNVENALSSLLDAGWAPTSASQASGVAAALAGPPPWAVGIAPCVSACPHAPDTLPSRALAPWAGLSRSHSLTCVSPLSALLLWLREWHLRRSQCLLLPGWRARSHLPR